MPKHLKRHICDVFISKQWHACLGTVSKVKFWCFNLKSSGGLTSCVADIHFQNIFVPQRKFVSSFLVLWWTLNFVECPLTTVLLMSQTGIAIFMSTRHFLKVQVLTSLQRHFSYKICFNSISYIINSYIRLSNFDIFHRINFLYALFLLTGHTWKSFIFKLQIFYPVRN